MDARSLALLEFPLVRARLADATSFPPSQRLAEALEPSADPVVVARSLDETDQARALLAEVSTADSDYFFALKNFEAPLFEGVRMHDERHRRALRELHERLIRLQFFMRPGGN